MNEVRVLFICVHNSARSQMAEAFLNKHGAGRFAAESAGLEPGRLNQVVVDSMKEVGIDISHNETKSVFEFVREGRRYDYVITVCDESNAERCPIFPGAIMTLHWSFRDPSSLTGDYGEKLAGTRAIRDEIERRVKLWLAEFSRKADGGK